MRLLMMITGLTILVLSSSNLLADDVYKWVDANGVTHYQAHPPKDRKTEFIKTKTGHSAPVKYNSKTDQALAQKDAGSTPSAASKKDPERCSQAQANLKTLRENSRIRITGEDGELRYLVPKEIEEQKANSTRVANEAC